MKKLFVIISLFLVFSVNLVAAQEMKVYATYGSWVLLYIDVARGQPPFEQGGQYWMLAGLATESKNTNKLPTISFAHDTHTGSLRCMIRWQTTYGGGEVTTKYGKGPVIKFNTDKLPESASMEQLTASLDAAQISNPDLFIKLLLEMDPSEKIVIETKTVPSFDPSSMTKDGTMAPPPIITGVWNAAGFREAYAVYLKNTKIWLNKIK